MIVDCVSDLHGSYPKLEGGDVLIVAGDLTAMDLPVQHEMVNSWLSLQKYKHKIVIAGNHDGYLEKNHGSSIYNAIGVHYLCDSGVELVTNCKRLKFWGSPWTPTFFEWYFMRDRGPPIKEKWDLIPEDTDILITHGPPYGILDEVERGKLTGCEELRKTIERIQPRLHVFGHLHEGYGQTTLKCTPKDVMCVNASIMDYRYRPVNKPIRVIL